MASLSCKGINTPDRPWRWSKLTIVPAPITVADKALLEKLAAMAPEKNPRRDTGEKRQGPWSKMWKHASLPGVDWMEWQAASRAKAG